LKHRGGDAFRRGFDQPRTVGRADASALVASEGDLPAAKRPARLKPDFIRGPAYIDANVIDMLR
jgi:hypothetical protein